MAAVISPLRATGAFWRNHIVAPGLSVGFSFAAQRDSVPLLVSPVRCWSLCPVGARVSSC